MKQITQLVIYRDNKGKPELFFGPFMSDDIARFFKAQMPIPQEGGYCRIVPIQPFTQHEGHIVNRKILSERNHVH